MGRPRCRLYSHREFPASPPIGSAVDTASEALLPSREDAMLEITRISLSNMLPSLLAAVGLCALAASFAGTI